MMEEGDGPTVWVWNESLSVGIPEIDEDHQRFISLVNDLNQAIVSRQAKTEIGRLLKLLVVDARSHFDFEEQLFEEYRYPDVRRHSEAHAQLMSRLLAEAVEFSNAEWSPVWIEKGFLIKKLLLTHLLEEDMDYRGFLGSQVKAPSESKG